MFDVKTLEWVINVSPESLRGRLPPAPEQGQRLIRPPELTFPDTGWASASGGLDFPEILAGTAQLLAPGSE